MWELHSDKQFILDFYTSPLIAYIIGLLYLPYQPQKHPLLTMYFFPKSARFPIQVEQQPMAE